MQGRQMLNFIENVERTIIGENAGIEFGQRSHRNPLVWVIGR